MEEYRIADHDNRIYSMGLTTVCGGVHFCVAAKGEVLKLLLFGKGKSEPAAALAFPVEDRHGDVWEMTVIGNDFTDMEYCYEIDGKPFADPYGRAFSGREIWGDLTAADRLMRSPVAIPDFDWEGDKPLEIPYEDSIIYRLHVRGFTKHVSSKTSNKGTFKAITEKIPYLKDLGVTALEFLPVYEFPEVMMPERAEGDPFLDDKPTGRLNYWGYVPGYCFAPRASYSSGKEKNPTAEFKTLVKTLHKSGLEVIVELYFTGQESPSYVLDACRFWVEYYHVDGIHLVGNAPKGVIGQDPYLSRTKLFADYWDGVPEGGRKHLAEYQEGFCVDMRQVLKGDENQMNSLAFRSRRNPAGYGVINYMANTNGFTMMDMVSYDTKHNEANGEKNQDGTSWNFSWNCGIEGATKKKKIVELRKKQLRNAFLLLFLSQGTPLLLAGDEFGNSKGGNNNSYCQDNDVSWLNWNLLRTNRDLYEFVKYAIAFRKKHSVFHMEKEPRIMDYLSCGQPDVSYHGVKAWFPDFDNSSRQLGIMYCGKYGTKADGTEDDSFYVAYNMHWEPHEFDLPNLPKGQKWHVAMNTDEAERNGIYEDGEEPAVDSKHFMVPERSIVVFIGK